jgi:hypothetical protein
MEYKGRTNKPLKKLCIDRESVMSICDHKGRGWGRKEEGLF